MFEEARACRAKKGKAAILTRREDAEPFRGIASLAATATDCARRVSALQVCSVFCYLVSRTRRVEISISNRAATVSLARG